MEYAALLCIIVPCVITFFAGYWYALYRNGLVKITRQARSDAVCAACGHPHKDKPCDCGCVAFVEDKS